MNKLIPIKAIGCPWHGRAVDDTFDGGPGPPYPTVSYRPAGATWGPAIPIVHPNAPGSTLDAGTDRSWGMYIGYERSINGADGGTGIGWERWLYCDPTTDATWLMRADFTVTTTGVDIEVYCDGVFGRFRPDDPYPAVTPRLVQSFTWTPDLPSWNVWSYTVTQVMAEIQTPDGIGNLSISRDGATVWFHFYTTTNGNIAQNLYGPTNQIPHYWGLSSGIAVAGIAKCVLSGSSEAIDGGTAITATITKDVVYEGTSSNSLCWTYLKGANYTHEALLYRTEDGDIIRDYDCVIATGAFTVTHYLWDQTWSDSGTISAYDGGCELKVYSQNAVYVATYKVAAYFGFSRTFAQRWYGLDWIGNASQIDSIGLLGSNWVAPSSAFHGMPYTRKWVGTFSPHNPSFTFEIYDAVYLTPYTGTVYQYI